VVISTSQITHQHGQAYLLIELDQLMFKPSYFTMHVWTN
jgi:hypothetical protein